MPLTALAGFVGDREPSDSSRSCARALDGLSLFGRDPQILAAGHASFGARHPSSSSAPGRALFRDERRLVAFDGDLHDREGLRQGLDLPPDIDGAALIAAAWARWGPGSLDRLVGEFALAIYDLDQRRLWLARDLSGYRPLYFAHTPSGTLFATMPSGILAAHDAPADFARFAGFVEGRLFESGASFWSGVRQVPSGGVLCISGAGVMSARLAIRNPGLSPTPQWPDLIAALRERLDRAVARNLSDAGPLVGAHLSSGLDSSAITTAAAGLTDSSQSLIAWTGAPAHGARLLPARGRFGDESALAAATARKAGIAHVVVRETTPLLAAVRGTSQYFQQPAPAQFSLPWWCSINRDLRGRGGSVLLTAGMGNGTLSYGGLGALARFVRRGDVRQWWRELGAVRRNEAVRRRGLIYNSFAPWLPQALTDRLWRSTQRLPPAPPSFLREEWRGPRAVPVAMPGEQEARLATIRNFDAGNRKRGMFALTGIEERDPTADRELLEFTMALPPEAHLRDGRIKPLLRDMLAERVPREVIDNRQRGMSGADWYDLLAPGDCRVALEEISASSSAVQLLDMDALTGAINRWPAFDPARAAALSEFGRSIARALSTGLFLAETDRYPLGRSERQ